MNLLSMTIVLIASSVFLFAILNLIFGFRRRIKVRYFPKLKPEEAADISRKVIEKYPYKATIFIIAGEFNYEFYETFIPHLQELIRSKKFTVKVIGGPSISVRDEASKRQSDNRKVNMILSAAFDNQIELYLKDKGRERDHFIMCENSNEVALLEDPHAEHEERGTSVIYDSKVYCDNLRRRFKRILKEEELLRVHSPAQLEELRPRFKTMKDFSMVSRAAESEEERPRVRL